MLSQKVRFPSFFWVSGIPLYTYSTVYIYDTYTYCTHIHIQLYTMSYMYTMEYHCIQAFKKFNLLVWHLFTKPWRFQVYTSIKHYLHTASCLHPSKQNLFPSSFYSPFAHLHLPHPPFPSGCHYTVGCVYVFYMCVCVFFWLNPLTFLHPVFQNTSPLRAVSLFHVSMTLFIFCQFIFLLDSTYN